MTYDTTAIPSGFIKLMRSDPTRELLKDSKAFTLYTQIALRAKRTSDFNLHGLTPGQALIGDHASCGLSRREYRNAKSRLERYHLARFQGTNRGTIATLLSAAVYDINEERQGHPEGTQGASRRPTEDQQGATNKNEKKEKNEKKGKAHRFGSFQSADRTPRTFQEMDRDRAERAMVQAREEFLNDDEG
ncbi:MAG: hypothetical protein GXY19_01410 [Phycisphaerae bacterium]|nr:hypothetical protein [Phycisphaerae bacterium]